MKKILSLILILVATALSHAFADDTNKTDSFCDAEISITLKEPVKEIKTNKSVVVMIQIKNTSTNEILMFQIQSAPTDFTWVITSPSGRKLLPAEQSPAWESGWNPKLEPQESREADYDLSSIYSFDEIGTYKIVAKKQVLSSFTKRKVCEIISNPLSIVVSETKINALPK